MSESRHAGGHKPFQNRKSNCVTAKNPVELLSWLTKAAFLTFLAVYLLFLLFSSLSGCSLRPESVAVVRYSDDRTDEKPTSISHLVFGIAGSVSNWEQRRRHVELWWKPGVTRGFVWLDEKPPKNKAWLDSSPPYRVSEDTSRFLFACPTCPRSAIRIARIVSESFRLGLKNVRWFVMGDDDTVFFTENLVAVLSKYDHEKFYYIGGVSESVEQNLMHSYGLAFGGGGFAISYALATELDRVLDGCINRYANFYGSDERVHACVSELGVPLTREPGFHQMDVQGDLYGLLAAHPIAPLVSLHHLDYLKPIIPNRNQLDALQLLFDAARVDSARALQQTFCYDATLKWSVSVSWGYTVQIYPSILRAIELENPLQTFNTWQAYGNNAFTFNTRPQMDDVCERPVIFFLDQVEDFGQGETLTDYKRYVPESEIGCDHPAYIHASSIDTVTVFSPKMESPDLNKGPRRQCCETNRTVGDKSIEVRIRKCNVGETISSP